MKNAYVKGKEKENHARNSIRISISEVAEMYFDDLKKYNYSQKTIKSYKASFKRFSLFLKTEHIMDITEITTEILDKFRASSLNDGLAVGTVGILVKVVRIFFQYLESEGIIFDNPAINLKAPRLEKKLQYVPSEEDMRKLLSQPNTAISTGIRDRAIMEVAYSTGIRLEELTSLKLSSIDLKNKVLRVLGKGKKERTVPLTKASCHWLERYLSGARKDLLRYNLNEEGLWIGRLKTAMGNQAFTARLRQYSKEAKIRKITTHAVRRACATHMLRNGAHPVQIQMLLGHSDLSTLSHYISITVEDMKKTHRKSRVGR